MRLRRRPVPRAAPRPAAPPSHRHRRPKPFMSAWMPSSTARATRSQYIEMARRASSLPGSVGDCRPDRSFESRIAATGMPSLRASAMAMPSLFGVDDEDQVGQPAPMSLMPPSERSSLSFSRVRFSSSFLVKAGGVALQRSSSSRNRLIDARWSSSWSACRRASRWLTEVLAATLWLILDRLGPLALGADEQHPAAVGDECRAPRSSARSSIRPRSGPEVDDLVHVVVRTP